MKQEHPMQPIYLTKDREARFKPNAIVRFILDHGGINLNMIGDMRFSKDDQMQFAQLIGYSVEGYGNLDYVSNKSYNQAAIIAAVLEVEAE